MLYVFMINSIGTVPPTVEIYLAAADLYYSGDIRKWVIIAIYVHAYRLTNFPVSDTWYKLPSTHPNTTCPLENSDGEENMGEEHDMVHFTSPVSYEVITKPQVKK